MAKLEELTRSSKEAALELGGFVRANSAPMLIVFYLFLWFLVVRSGLPGFSRAGKVIIVYSMVPICLLYLFHRWGQPFLWVWDTRGGKILYLMASAILLAVSKSLADNLIGSVLQTSADRFPDAQNCLTLYFVILLNVGIIGAGMTAVYAFVLLLIFGLGVNMLVARWIVEGMVQQFPASSKLRDLRLVKLLLEKANLGTASIIFIDAFVFLIWGLFISRVPIVAERPSWIRDESGHYMRLAEDVLILSSFYSNKVSNDATGEPQKVICSNLPLDVKISMVNPDEVAPHDAMIAEINRGKKNDYENAYTYKLSKCENTNDPDHVKH